MVLPFSVAGNPQKIGKKYIGNQGEMTMKKLPIGKQVFRNVIEDGCVYVDKTEHLIRMINLSTPLFLSRPRRFGKSMTTYTLLELFEGNCELFQGTFAYDNWNWERKTPVIRLDMSICSGATIEEIRAKMLTMVILCAKDAGVQISDTVYADIAFMELISSLSKKGRIAIIVDEYDAPILDNLHEPILPAVKSLLRNFYKLIKAYEEHLCFVFITGISKFSKVGVFSAMNNLQDITLNVKYSSITGYTRNEIDLYFREYIELAKSELNYSEEQFWVELKHYYNGYSWDGETFLYNPFSVLNFFSQFQFSPYWMASGSPSYMVRYAEQNHLSLENLKKKSVDSAFMDRKDIDLASPESFLTQAGYLTIKSVDQYGDYVLDFPNYEVEYTFNALLVDSQFQVVSDDLMGVKRAIRNAFIANDTDEVIRQIKIVYSSVPYVHFDNNKNEHFYHTMLLMFLRACGFDLLTEDLSNKGRSDLSLFWKERVYLIELKIDGSAQSALDQIIEKNYTGKYENLEIVHIGLKIDFDERNIVEWAWR